MYYKIILNDGIINAIKTPFNTCIYSNFLKDFIRCDNNKPQAFSCWRTNKVYYVEGWDKPPQDVLNTMETVQFVEITEEEYKELKQRLDDEQAPVDASLFAPVPTIEPEEKNTYIPSQPVVRTAAELLKDEIDSLKQQNEELRQMVMALLNK